MCWKLIASTMSSSKSKRGGGGSRDLNTEQLTCIGNKLLAGKSTRFLGVYAADRIPRLDEKQEHYPCALIANTDPSTESGEHWIAYYLSSPNSPIEFFDSYGLEPNFYPNLPKFTSPLVHNSASLQSLNSLVCGHYCLLFIYLRSRNKSIAKIVRFILSNSHSHSKSFDTFVHTYVCSLVKLFHVLIPCTTRLSSSQCCHSRSSCSLVT